MHQSTTDLYKVTTTEFSDILLVYDKKAPVGGGGSSSALTTEPTTTEPKGEVQAKIVPPISNPYTASSGAKILFSIIGGGILLGLVSLGINHYKKKKNETKK